MRWSLSKLGANQFAPFFFVALLSAALGAMNLAGLRNPIQIDAFGLLIAVNVVSASLG
jgi:hypothetical protein